MPRGAGRALRGAETDRPGGKRQAGYGKVAVVEALEAELQISPHRTVTVTLRLLLCARLRFTPIELDGRRWYQAKAPTTGFSAEKLAARLHAATLPRIFPLSWRKHSLG